jgi:hypothetical protein
MILHGCWKFLFVQLSDTDVTFVQLSATDLESENIKASLVNKSGTAIFVLTALSSYIYTCFIRFERKVSPDGNSASACVGSSSNGVEYSNMNTEYIMCKIGLFRILGIVKKQ